MLIPPVMKRASCSNPRRIAEVVAYAGSNGFTIEDISVARPSLGDVFLKYTGRALRD